MRVIMRTAVVALGCWLSTSTVAVLAAEQADFVGIWLSEKGDGAFEFRPCGASVCGYVFSIFSVPDPSLPLRDNRNEKADLRKRPLCGLQTFGNLKKVSSDALGDGWVYDPDTGKSYSVEVTMESHDAIAVRGYVGTKLFGKTVNFKRAQAAPQKCTPLKDS